MDVTFDKLADARLTRPLRDLDNGWSVRFNTETFDRATLGTNLEIINSGSKVYPKCKVYPNFSSDERGEPDELVGYSVVYQAARSPDSWYELHNATIHRALKTAVSLCEERPLVGLTRTSIAPEIDHDFYELENGDYYATDDSLAVFLSVGISKYIYRLAEQSNESWHEVERAVFSDDSSIKRSDVVAFLLTESDTGCRLDKEQAPWVAPVLDAADSVSDIPELAR